MIVFTPVMMILRVMSQTVVLALVQIFNNKIRTFLTTLGIIVAVASIILVMGALSGMQRGVLDQFEQFGVKRVFMDGTLPQSMRGKLSWRDVQLKQEEVEAIREYVTSLEHFCPMYFGSYSVQYNEIILEGIRTAGIEPSWHDIEHRDIINGRRFTKIDLEQRRNVCVINEKAIEELTRQARQPSPPQPAPVNGHYPAPRPAVVAEKTITVLNITDAMLPYPYTNGNGHAPNGHSAAPHANGGPYMN